MDNLKFKNTFSFEVVRNGEVVETFEVDNLVTTQGVNDMLETQFRGGAQKSWYFGLIRDSGFTSSANSDTALSHPGWTEYTAYSEATRQEFVAAAASGRAVVSSTSLATFTMAADVVMRGIALFSSNVKGSTDGILFSVATLPIARQLLAGDQYRVSYTTTLS